MASVSGRRSPAMAVVRAVSPRLSSRSAWSQDTLLRAFSPLIQKWLDNLINLISIQNVCDTYQYPALKADFFKSKKYFKDRANLLLVRQSGEEPRVIHELLLPCQHFLQLYRFLISHLIQGFSIQTVKSKYWWQCLFVYILIYLMEVK